jgi:hypothetical protein
MEDKTTEHKKHLLWDRSTVLPKREEIPLLDEQTMVIVFRGIHGEYQFLHEASICQHRGTWFSAWQNEPQDESGPWQVVRGALSLDGGHTWTEPHVIASTDNGVDLYEGSNLFVFEDHLFLFTCSFHDRYYGRDGGDPHPGLCMKGFSYDDSKKKWEPMGVLLEGFKPMEAPKHLGNGSLVIGGHDSYGQPHVAVSRGRDLERWTAIALPTPRGRRLSMAEVATLVRGHSVTALSRYEYWDAQDRQSHTSVALASESDDAGMTWSELRETNFPAAITKLFAGTLSDGRPYVISNWPAEGESGCRDRLHLTISVGKAGTKILSKAWTIRSGPPPTVRFPGRGKKQQWSYPFACEHSGNLYVIFTINKEDCALSIIPMRVLNNGLA